MTQAQHHMLFGDKFKHWGRWRNICGDWN